MADKLTPEQAQAVENRGGRLLVSAAAGSGKTKVLVDRLLTYLTNPADPANLDEFLIITYTKAAASELRGKIAAKLTERIAQEPDNRHLQKQMQRLFLTKISTVHGFCSDLLREYAYRLDVAPDFRVADESECREIRSQVLEDLLDSAYANAENREDFLAFTDTQGLGRDDRLVPEIIEKVYDSARCHLNPDGWLNACLKATETEDITDAGETVWGKYLMEDLYDYLDCQIQVLEQCRRELEASDEMEKPAANLGQTLNQLKNLRVSKTWDEIVRQGKIDYGRLTFPRKLSDPELSERVKAARNACKDGLERKLRSFSDLSDGILQDLSQCAAGARGLVALVRQFDRDYSAAKRSRRVLDFGDLEHRTLDLLLGKNRTSPTAVSEEIAKRFREILVDEYQDSNGVQDAIFTVLSEKRQNAFLVGDVKQSIYQFRLADPGIFLEKYRDFLPVEQAQPKQGRKVLLSHNFRSGAEVIEGVNAVFSTCMRPKVGGLLYGEAEQLREGIPHVPLEEPGVELYALEVREDAYAEEADFVAQKIQSMLREGTTIRKNGKLSPVTPEDIVILLRSPGSAGGSFQRALEKLGIRCTSGGGTDLLQTEEIATFRALLQTIQNPRQDIPLITVLASPIFGFTADDLARFRSRQKKGSVYDALLQSDTLKSQEFLDILGTLRQEARHSTLTALLERCFCLTRIDSLYAATAGGAAKRANLQTFYQLAADYEQGNLRDLSQFLDYLDSLEDRGLVMPGAANSGCVSIMSIHKSKGLEFPVVFLCNLSRKFNQESLRAQILCDKTLGLGLSVADQEKRIRYPSIAKRAIAVKMEAESVSEELRVLYVAMTRAKDRLIMTYAAKSLEKDLQQIALRQDFDGGELLCRDAVCLGDWVLLAAMSRREAGELHNLGGRPGHTQLNEHLWKITVCQPPEPMQENIQELQQSIRLPEGVQTRLENALAFHYPHMAATMAPSKQTATGRKGRLKDAEAAEDTQEPKPTQRNWRQPTFKNRKTDARAYGVAMHAALQYMDFRMGTSAESVAQEVQRLVQSGVLTQEQGQLVNCRQLAQFFATEIGRKLAAGAECLREFKFSILDDGSHYGEGLEGEQVLLQGVVDCALLEENGITIVDFKTDAVTEQNLSTAVERYRPQVQTYAQALSRIYEQPVIGMYLYFFHRGQLVLL